MIVLEKSKNLRDRNYHGKVEMLPAQNSIDRKVGYRDCVDDERTRKA